MATSTYSYFLSFLGLCLLASWSRHLYAFVRLHFIHRSTLPSYVSLTPGSKSKTTSSASYALITGASDGIGMGFAQELLSSGFNVIIHGRNPTKLDKAKASLQQQYPARDVRTFALDVSDESKWMSAIKELLASLKADNIPLRALINNVGGGPGHPHATLTKTLNRETDAANAMLNLNATFPATFTQALLPVLVQHQPSFIINIGSGSQLLPIPHLGLYGGSKAFLSRWSQCMSLEMEVEGLHVEVFNTIVGKTLNQGSAGKKPTLFEPSSRTLAKSALNKLGAGVRECVPYWGHAVQFAMMMSLPDFVLEKISKEISQTEIREEMERKVQIVKAQ